MAEQRPRVFLDVSIAGEPAGRLVIELFADKAPRTCENFRALCVGTAPPLTYRNVPFHRIVEDYIVQGGDTTRGNGTGGASIYDGEFADENLGWRDVDVAGLVCMANRGKATNTSQFFITLAAAPNLNGRNTIFGHLVDGQEVLRRMASVAVDDEDQPTQPVTITHSGELERRRRTDDSERRKFQMTRQDSDLPRGRHLERRHARSPSPTVRRRRRSPSSTAPSGNSSQQESPRKNRRHERLRSRSPHLAPSTRGRYRRRSDHSLDENIRGRVRHRSRTRSATSMGEQEDAMEEDIDEEEERVAKRLQHEKRRRSRSPSRSGGRVNSNSPPFRRRRSLPNHYERRREGGYGAGSAHGQHGQRPGGDGRLGDASDDGDGIAVAAGIKFKGRGSMKYHEKKR